MTIKVTVVSTPKNRVSINNQKREVIRSVGISPPNAITRLQDLSDVDATDLDNDETLVYDETTGKFVVKALPGLDGGIF
jgi:hypothetical protein